MSNYTLLIFEGQKTEHNIVDNLKNYYRTALPESILFQDDIFEKQKIKHIEPNIEPNREISVISAFPLMLHEYYGCKLFAKLET